MKFLPLLLILIAALPLAAADIPGPEQTTWKNSPINRDPNFFPLSVWYQDVRHAAEYKALGINLYITPWDNTHADDYLAALKQAGLKLICDQTEATLKHVDDPTIIGWLQEDEPDNAQGMKKGWNDDLAAIHKAWPSLPEKTLAQWGQYGPPHSPSMIIERYQAMHKNDPTRPVMLGLGQSIAWDAYHGRGVRSGHNEDYPEYAKGGDILAFDIYPVVHSSPQVKGKLEYVAKGVEHLMQLGKGIKPVFAAIETTHISNPNAKPTPEQTRSEVWMAIIHGARGINYFCHEFRPKFIEAGFLDDKPMCDMIAHVNKQITALAPVLNSPTLAGAATVQTSGAPVDILVKKHEGATYIFAIAMRDEPAKASFTLADLPGNAAAEVLGEDRKLDAPGGKFSDDFAGYAVHIYKIAAP